MLSSMEIINILIEKYKFSCASLALKVGVCNQTFSSYRTGRYSVPKLVHEKLVQILSVWENF